MKTQKAEIKITPPKSVHVIAWEFPKISYRIVSKTGETLLSCNQGFERVKGLEKNLLAVSDLFLQGKTFDKITIYWVLNKNSKRILKETILWV